MAISDTIKKGLIRAPHRSLLRATGVIQSESDFNKPFIAVCNSFVQIIPGHAHLDVVGRKVRESSLSFVMPHHGERAILRCRDDHYLHPVPPLDIAECRALHLDGHQADAAIEYAKQFIHAYNLELWQGDRRVTTFKFDKQSKVK